MAADSLFDNVALLLHCDGSNGSTTITDVKGHTLTAANGAALSTAQSRFGTASLLFDGIDNVVTSPNSASLDVNNVDFCIEFWIYLPTGSAGGTVIRYGKATNFTNWAVSITSGGQVNFAYGNSSQSQSWNQSNPAGIPRDQWVFIKASRTGTGVQVWVNGSAYYSVSTATINTSTISAATLFIGRSAENTTPLDAYIDDLRVTIGNSRASTNTTVPTAAFPDVGISIIGSIPVSITLNATLTAIRAYQITGNIPVSVSLSATMSRTLGIIGNIPITVTLDAVMGKVGNNAIVGSIHVTVTLDAQLARTVDIVGSIPVSVGLLSTFSHAFTIDGNIPVAVSLNATLEHSRNPTPFDNLFEYVALLVHADGSNGSTTITDVKGHALTANNGAAISTTQSKWVGSSLKLDGVNDYVSIPHAADLGVTGVDWCVECWVYLLNGSTGGFIIGSGTVGNPALNWGLGLSSALYPTIYVGDTQLGGGYIWFPTALSEATWHHLKVSRTGNTVAAWLDAVAIGSATTATVQTARSNDVVQIGKNLDGTGILNAYLDDLRVTIGNSRAATNTTLPTAPYLDRGMPNQIGNIPVSVSLTSAMSRTVSMVGDIPIVALLDAQMLAIRVYSIVGDIPVIALLDATLLKRIQTWDITGTIPISVSLNAGMLATRIYSIAGEIPVAVTLNAVFSRTVSITGLIAVTATLDAVLSKIARNNFTGMIAVSVTLSARMTKRIVVPAHWIRRAYLFKLTGTVEQGDLVMPISSLNVDMTVSGYSTMSVVVQDMGNYLNAITARKTGNMVLSRAYTYDDGSVVVNEFVRVKYDNLRYDAGAKSGTSITLVGRRKIAGNSNKSVEITGLSYKGYDGKKLRYRCAIDDSVSLADTVTINGDNFVVGKITYNATAKTEQMEITEYVADGVDSVGAIGGNARPAALKQYSVVKSNPNYSAWMSQAFIYAGITESTLTIGQAYTLYYDSVGKLWYLAGNEGGSNQAVMLNSVQATINT